MRLTKEQLTEICEHIYGKSWRRRLTKAIRDDMDVGAAITFADLDGWLREGQIPWFIAYVLINEIGRHRDQECARQRRLDELNAVCCDIGEHYRRVGLHR